MRKRAKKVGNKKNLSRKLIQAGKGLEESELERVQKIITETQEHQESLEQSVSTLKSELIRNQAITQGMSRVNIGIDIVGTDYRIHYQNQFLQERFGQLEGKLCYEAYTGSTEPCDDCPMKGATTEGCTHSCEIKGSDGRIYQVISSPIHNSEGVADRAIEVVVDITEQVKIKEELVRKDQWLKALFEGAPEAYCVSDAKGNIINIAELHESEETFRDLAEQLPNMIFVYKEGQVVYANEACEKTMGYKRAEFYSPAFDFFTLVAPEARELVRSAFTTCMNGEELPPYEHTIINREGRRIQVIQTTRLITCEGAQAILSIITDITSFKQTQEALRQSEERYRHLTENAGQAIIVVQDGTVKFSNPKATELGGYSKEELTSKPFAEFIHPDDLYMVVDRYFKRLKGEVPPPIYDFRIVRKDGVVRWAELNAVSISWENRPAVLCFISDISERKETEQLLIDEASRRRILMEQSRDGIVILDQDGRVYDCNQRFAAMVGYPVESMHQLTVFDWEHLHPPERIIELIQNVDENGDHFETKHRRKDGSTYDVEISANAAMYAGEKLIFCVCRDITERKEMEEALRQSEERLRLLMESMEDVIVMVDLDAKCLYFHSPSRYGLRQSDVLGKTPYDLLEPEVANELVRGIKQVIADGCSITSENRVNWGGETFWLSNSINPVRDTDGTIVAVTMIMRNITEWKKAQERLMVTERLASVGELASGIAHELSNPLTGIIGFSDLLLQKDVPDDVRGNLEVMNREAKRTAKVVKGLLSFARKHPQNEEAVNINDAIRKVLDMRAYEQKVNNIQVNTRFDSRLPEIIADAFQLQQVFMNIIINAEYFMIEAHSGGTLNISTGQVGAILKVSFADDGPGIAKENLEHLFDPFFTTKDIGKGTGLGLSICHGIISGHGGRIYAESELGKGATFVIELPISMAHRKEA